MALRVGSNHFTANIGDGIQAAGNELFFRYSELPFKHLGTSCGEPISSFARCHGSRIEGLVKSCDTSGMTWIRRNFRNSEITVIGALLAIIMTVIFSEGARAAGFGLFRQIADSYLIMFIDSMSMGFICF
tara:strand:+ start:289 stop:678 length:390 start_codon:yes stop_codon:yes gene_type:complete